MAQAEVLRRVAADLASGHTQPAIQRLASLVATNPTDLNLRRRLAVAYRRTGNAIEAGRWSYLNPDADPTETGAFERAYPSPAQRLHKLHWPARHGYAATDFARRRLARLAAEVPPAVPGNPLLAMLTPRWRGTRTRLAALVAAAVATPFAVIGALTVAGWIVG